MIDFGCHQQVINNTIASDQIVLCVRGCEFMQKAKQIGVIEADCINAFDLNYVPLSRCQ